MKEPKKFPKRKGGTLAQLEAFRAGVLPTVPAHPLAATMRESVLNDPTGGEVKRMWRHFVNEASCSYIENARKLDRDEQEQAKAEGREPDPDKLLGTTFYNDAKKLEAMMVIVRFFNDLPDFTKAATRRDQNTTNIMVMSGKDAPQLLKSGLDIMPQAHPQMESKDDIVVE